MAEILRIRKLADKSNGERVIRYDPVTGDKKLVNPATPGEEHEPWPLAGIDFVDENGQPTDPPQETSISTSKVSEGISEGWLTREGERPVVRPAGRTQGEWNSTHSGAPHTFLHADTLVFHAAVGDVRYRVTHQPDKYVDTDWADDETPVSPELYAAGNTRVDHFYGLELERVN